MSMKKQFNCDICENKFKSKQGLEIHIRVIHEKRKDFGRCRKECWDSSVFENFRKRELL